MKKQLIGLAALLVACSPQKEVRDPVISEIKIEDRIIEKVELEPQKEDEKEAPNNGYRNLGEECGQITLESGKYPVRMKGWDASYDVEIWNSRKDCYLALSTSEISATVIDNDCDNSTDSVNIKKYPIPLNLIPSEHISLRLERAELESLGYKKQLDRILEGAQQFACPENKRRLQEYLLKKILETGNK